MPRFLIPAFESEPDFEFAASYWRPSQDDAKWASSSTVATDHVSIQIRSDRKQYSLYERLPKRAEHDFPITLGGHARPARSRSVPSRLLKYNLNGLRIWKVKDTVCTACPKTKNRIAEPKTNYFSPVVAIPRINVFCARKNSMITGSMISIDAAISRFQSVPPCWL